MKQRVKKITEKNFKVFGWIINFPQKNFQDKKKNLFRIVVRETAKSGWRIAYLVLRDKYIKKFEQHPDSLESFEPVCGKSLLCVAAAKDLQGIKAFFLDKPVILKKGIWHAVVTLDDESEIKITENAKVKSLFWRLGDLLKPVW